MIVVHVSSPVIVTDGVPHTVVPDHNVSVVGVAQSDLVGVSTRGSVHRAVVRNARTARQGVPAVARLAVSSVVSGARGTAGSDTVRAGALVQRARTARQGVSAVARGAVSSVVRGASGSGASGTVGAGALVENASTAGQSVPTIARTALLGGARQRDITSTIVTVALVAALGGTASGNAATVGVGRAS